MKVIAKWKNEYFPYAERMKFVEMPPGVETWRQMQQFFDPAYRCDYLQFYMLGDQVENKE